MKYLVFLGAFVGLVFCVHQVFGRGTQKPSESDLRFSAYYLGCIEGFIILNDLNAYQRPEGYTAHSLFKEYKETCTYKANLYRNSL